MNNGKSIWVRDPMNGMIKKEGVLEFEKGSEVVVSFSEYEFLCVFNKSQIVDPPSASEIEMQETNHLVNTILDKGRAQDSNYHRILEELGYKIVKMECK